MVTFKLSKTDVCQIFVSWSWWRNKVENSRKSFRMSVTVHKNECEENSQYLTDPLNHKASAIFSSLRELITLFIILVTAQAFTPVLLPLMSYQWQAPLKTGGKTEELNRWV